MATQQLPQSVRDYFSAIKALDAAAFAATFADDAVQEDPVGTPPNRDHATIRQFFEGIAVAFTAVELTPDEVFSAGPSMAIRWTGRGTSKGGKTVEFAGIDVIDLDDAGKIKHLRAFWNPGAMMAQL